MNKEVNQMQMISVVLSNAGGVIACESVDNEFDLAAVVLDMMKAGLQVGDTIRIVADEDCA